jgi:hypothetical protein
MGGTICRTREPDQVGKALIGLPWFIVNSFKRAIDRAEEKLGHPPMLPDIAACLVDEGSLFMILKKPPVLAFILWNCFREDMIMCDKKHLAQWTTKRKDGYATFSEFWREKSPDYELDAR